MAMSQADVLALRVAMQNVQKVRQDVATIRRDMRDLRAENLRAAQSQRGVKKGLDDSLTSARNLTREAKNTRSAWSGLKTTVLGMAGGFTALYGAARLGLSAIEKFESKQGFIRALQFNLGKDAGGRVGAQAEAFAQRQGLGLQDVRGGVAKLAGANVQADRIVPLLRAFTALGASGGATGEGIKRAFEQFTQIASQGKLQGDELRAIQENGVQLRKLLMDAGLGGRIGSQTQPITFEEIAQVLLKFGQRGDVNQLLGAQAAQGSASLERFFNVLNGKLLPAIGEGLTPALIELSTWAEQTVANMDPEAVKTTTRQVIEFGRTVGRAAPYLIGVAVGAKIVQAALAIRLTLAANSAAAALARLAVSANGAAIGTGLGGGIGKGAGAAGAAGLGGRIAGAGRTILGGAGRFIGSGAAGTAATATTIVGGAALAGISLVEKLSGVGADDSIFSNIMYGGFKPGAADSIRRAQASAAKPNAAFMNRHAIRQRLRRIAKAYHFKDENALRAMLPGVVDAYTTAEERAALGWSNSPRSSAYDSRASETNARSIRWAL